MTVRELITKLEEYGDDLEVVISDHAGDTYSIYDNVDTGTSDGELVVILEMAEKREA